MYRSTTETRLQGCRHSHVGGDACWNRREVCCNSASRVKLANNNFGNANNGIRSGVKYLLKFYQNLMRAGNHQFRSEIHFRNATETSRASVIFQDSVEGSIAMDFALIIGSMSTSRCDMNSIWNFTLRVLYRFSMNKVERNGMACRRTYIDMILEPIVASNVLSMPKPTHPNLIAKIATGTRLTTEYDLFSGKDRCQL